MGTGGEGVLAIVPRNLSMKQVRGKIGGYMSASLRAARDAVRSREYGDLEMGATFDHHADELRFEAMRWKAKLKEFPKKRRVRRCR